MKKTVQLCIFTAFMSQFPLIAQESEAPDIYLPPVVLEVQDTDVSRLSLPDPIIPEETPGLPGVLVESDGKASDFQLLSQIPLIDPLGGEAAVSDKRFFSEGTIGVGSANRLYGNIELTQMSREGPGFTAGFLHDSSDGFYPRDAGDGYFGRDDSIYGTFVYLKDPLNVYVQGDMAEHAWGFQGLGDYIDATGRGGSLHAEATYARDWLSGTLTGDGMYLSQVFGGENGLSGRYSEVTPRLDVKGSWENLALGIFGRTRISEDSIWEVGSSVQFDPQPWLGLTAGVSFLGDDMILPWNAGFEFSYFKGFTLTVSGGRKAESADPRAVTELAPMSPLQKAYPLESFWFVDSELKIIPSDTVTVTVSGETFLDREYHWLEESVSTDGLLYFAAEPYQVDFGGRYSAECRYSTSLNWYLSAGYAFDLLPDGIFGAENSLILSGEYTDAKRGFVVNSSLDVPFGDSSLLPLLNLSLGIPVNRNINIELAGTDLLSVAADEPRTLIGEYQTKGFEISFFTKISL